MPCFLLLFAGIAISSASECGSSKQCSLPDNIISFIQQNSQVRFRQKDQSIEEHGKDEDQKWFGEDEVLPVRGPLDRALEGAALDPLGPEDPLRPNAELPVNRLEQAFVQAEIKKKIADDNAIFHVSVANNAMEKAGMAGDALGSFALQDRAAKRARLAWRGAGWGAYAAARAAKSRAVWGTHAIQKAVNRNAYMNAKMASNEAWLNAFEKDKVAKTQTAAAVAAATSKARAAAMIKQAAKEKAWAAALGHHSLALEQSKQEAVKSEEAANPEDATQLQELATQLAEIVKSEEAANPEDETQLQELATQLEELAVQSRPAVEQAPQTAAETVLLSSPTRSPLEETVGQGQLQQMRKRGAVHSRTRMAAPRAAENAAHNAAVLSAAKATAETVQSEKKKHDDMILVSGNNKK